MSSSLLPPVAAVLFDLDGTLVDSAPDLVGTLNDMRQQRGLEVLPLQVLRGHCGSGARGLLGAGMAVFPGQSSYEELRDEFHARYELRILRLTQLFAPTQEMLESLRQRGLPWGIVTNKAMRFAQPLCLALGLSPQCSVLVAGDTTPHTKPHPAPLLEAARRLQLPASACVYVGDDQRDVQAGMAAGMRTLAAAWGYVHSQPPVESWGADVVLQHPEDLLQWLDLA